MAGWDFIVEHWDLDSFCHVKLWRAFCPWKFSWYCCFWCIALQLMVDMELVNSRYPRLPSTGLSMRFTRMHLSKWNLSSLAPRWHWWIFFSFFSCSFNVCSSMSCFDGTMIWNIWVLLSHMELGIKRFTFVDFIKFLIGYLRNDRQHWKQLYEHYK